MRMLSGGTNSALQFLSCISVGIAASPLPTNEKRAIKTLTVDSDAFLDEMADVALALRIRLDRIDVASVDYAESASGEPEVKNGDSTATSAEVTHQNQQNQGETPLQITHERSLGGADAAPKSNNYEGDLKANDSDIRLHFSDFVVDSPILPRRTSETSSTPSSLKSVFCIDVLELHPDDLDVADGVVPGSHLPLILGHDTGRRLEMVGRDTARRMDLGRKTGINRRVDPLTIGFPFDLMTSKGDALCDELLARVEKVNATEMHTRHGNGQSTSYLPSSNSPMFFPRSPVSAAHQCVLFDKLKGNISLLHRKVLFEVLPRPDFTMGLQPKPGIVCISKKVQNTQRVQNSGVNYRNSGVKNDGIVDGSIGSNDGMIRSTRLLGPLQYIRAPEVEMQTRQMKIEVHTFLNPGWNYLVSLRCKGCIPGEKYRLSIRDINLSECFNTPRQRMLMEKMLTKNASVVGDAYYATHNLDSSSHQVDRMLADKPTGQTPTFVSSTKNWPMMCQLQNPCELGTHLSDLEYFAGKKPVWSPQNRRASSARDKMTLLDTVEGKHRKHVDKPFSSQLVDMLGQSFRRLMEGSGDVSPVLDDEARSLSEGTAPLSGVKEGRSLQVDDTTWIPDKIWSADPEERLITGAINIVKDHNVEDSKSLADALSRTHVTRNSTTDDATKSTTDDTATTNKDDGEPVSLSKFDNELSIVERSDHWGILEPRDDNYPPWATTKDNQPSIINNQVVFRIQSNHRMASSERRTWLHRSLVACFHPDAENYPAVGLLVGHANFKMDSNDIESFVFAICFFAVGLPVFCISTAVLYRSKCVSSRLRQRTLGFWMERSRLEDELINVQGMRSRLDSI